MHRNGINNFSRNITNDNIGKQSVAPPTNSSPPSSNYLGSSVRQKSQVSSYADYKQKKFLKTRQNTNESSADLIPVINNSNYDD